MRPLTTRRGPEIGDGNRGQPPISGASASSCPGFSSFLGALRITDVNVGPPAAPTSRRNCQTPADARDASTSADASVPPRPSPCPPTGASSPHAAAASTTPPGPAARLHPCRRNVRPRSTSDIATRDAPASHAPDFARRRSWPSRSARRRARTSGNGFARGARCGRAGG